MNGAGETSLIEVAKLGVSMSIDADWSKSPWRDIAPVALDHYMGSMPAHFPKTQFRIAYDDLAIYAIFRVEDRYVRAVARDYQDPVYKDSCVEFFFAPNPEQPDDYFNIEVNCAGVFLFQFHRASDGACIEIPEPPASRIEVAGSLPGAVEPEIADPVTWTVEYRIGLEVLGEYCRIARPRPGAIWRANFYKCADESSHPHWLTWAPVDNLTPNFHLPEFFGIMAF